MDTKSDIDAWAYHWLDTWMKPDSKCGNIKRVKFHYSRNFVYGKGESSGDYLAIQFIINMNKL